MIPNIKKKQYIVIDSEVVAFNVNCFLVTTISAQCVVFTLSI